MEDQRIVELFFARSEQAVVELDKKYGNLLFRISDNILHSDEDAAECVNDAYLGVWNAIPPARPNPLCAFVCRIARNLSLKKYRERTAQKRGPALPLEELANCIPTSSAEEAVSARELGRTICRFLEGLDQESRVLFLRRYWFSDPVKDIALRLGVSENAVSARLRRLRVRLQQYLQEEGFA